MDLPAPAKSNLVIERKLNIVLDPAWEGALRTTSVMVGRMASYISDLHVRRIRNDGPFIEL